MLQNSERMQRLYGFPLAAFLAARPPDVQERFFAASAWDPAQLQLAHAQHAVGLLQQHGLLPHLLAASVHAEMGRFAGERMTTCEVVPGRLIGRLCLLALEPALACQVTLLMMLP